MPSREPRETKNLDIYGSKPLEWRRVRERLDRVGEHHTSFWLGTVGSDGAPHAAAVGAVWVDGDIYIVSGPTTRKSRDLAKDATCTVSVALPGLDLSTRGKATRVTDGPTLERLAAHYRGLGWPVQVEADTFVAPYSAPSAGRPPYYLYRFVIDTAYAVASEEPHGATRWRF